MEAKEENKRRVKIQKIYSFESTYCKIKSYWKGVLLLKAVIAWAAFALFILLLFDRPTIYPHTGLLFEPPVFAYANIQQAVILSRELDPGMNRTVVVYAGARWIGGLRAWYWKFTMRTFSGHGISTWPPLNRDGPATVLFLFISVDSQLKVRQLNVTGIKRKNIHGRSSLFSCLFLCH